jgi:hypothetical protein
MENKSKKIIVEEKPAVEKFENKKRQLKYREETKYDALNLTPENMKDLALFLNSEAGEHILEVHFAKSGDYFFNVYEFNGKKYSRIIKKHKYNPDSKELVETEIEVLDNTEIILTKSAEEIVDLYYNWKFEQDKLTK